ncbi:MAG: hypothetical protein C5B55_08685 [Blastocatellia bacterium]|nr:MAG: hypothetical protein C5B55_08685 [Blastocatellia bacterium]
MIRIALTGCGEHSRSSHAAPLARYAAQHPGELELVAACDLNNDRATEFCQSFGFARPYTDLDEMLDIEKVDACVCVMPMEQIVQMGIKLLERRIPCVIEKPLGTSIAEAERLSMAASETETPHMVSVNRRFMPYLNQVRSWMNEVGPPRYAKAVQVRHSRNEPDFIWSTGIHVIDALRYMVGDIESFEVNVQTSDTNSAVWYVISFQFKSGARGHVEILPTAGMVEESYEFLGERFRARVTAGTGTQRSLQSWHDDQLVAEARTDEDEPEDLRNGSYQEVEQFVRALQRGTRPRPEIKDVLPSARICFAIADSVRKNA